MHITIVARRDDGDDTQLRGAVNGDTGTVIAIAKGRAKGKVDHIKVVAEITVAIGVDSPLNAFVNKVGAAKAAEDLDCVQIRGRRDARANAQLGKRRS